MSAQVLGVFNEVDTAVQAIDGLRDAGFDDIEVYSPLPQHDLEHALHLPESPVRMFTLVGGLTGAASGFALATWTSLDWPLITGGKPIVSLPPFVVIAFELTILIGALSTVLGLFINTRLGKKHPELIYDPSFSAGTFGVMALTGPDRLPDARRVLQENGAASVEEVDHV